MKRNLLLISAFVLIALLLTAGMVLAAPPQGLLVDKDGTPVKGFSNVYVENGSAYPIYNAADQLWYNVFVIGTAADGTALCTLGQPMGVDSSEHYWESSQNPGAAAATVIDNTPK